jgi:hypothetical protein
MVIKDVNVSEIKMYEANAKLHTKDQIQHLKNSINEFGFSVPIVINNENVILAGHGRYLAAKELGLEVIPAIRVSHLTPEQEKQYRLVDNSTQLMSGFDYGVLQEEISGLFSFNAKDFGFGFSITENPESSEPLQEYSGSSSGNGRGSTNPGTDESPIEKTTTEPIPKYTCPGCGMKFNKNLSEEPPDNNLEVQNRLDKAMQELL